MCDFLTIGMKAVNWLKKISCRFYFLYFIIEKIESQKYLSNLCKIPQMVIGETQVFLTWKSVFSLAVPLTTDKTHMECYSHSILNVACCILEILYICMVSFCLGRTFIALFHLILTTKREEATSLFFLPSVLPSPHPVCHPQVYWEILTWFLSLRHMCGGMTYMLCEWIPTLDSANVHLI